MSVRRADRWRPGGRELPIPGRRKEVEPSCPLPGAAARKASTVVDGFWSNKAASYHSTHVCSGDQHYEALDSVAQHLTGLGLHSVLDVGCGTGRTTDYLLGRGFSVFGVEPMAALVDEAVSSVGLRPESLLRASGFALPFRDQSLDAVCETGVLHHVHDSAKVVAEMLRVARTAIFISDSNRFGQGPVWSRYLKLALYKGGLWNAIEFLRTRGRGWHYSDGDGLFYSFSVYDALTQIQAWADRVTIIPTAPPTSGGWLHPLRRRRTCCSARPGHRREPRTHTPIS